MGKAMGGVAADAFWACRSPGHLHPWHQNRHHCWAARNWLPRNRDICNHGAAHNRRVGRISLFVADFPALLPLNRRRRPACWRGKILRESDSGLSTENRCGISQFECLQEARANRFLRSVGAQSIGYKAVEAHSRNLCIAFRLQELGDS